VLSIGKLTIGQERYYLETVAAGVEDYYLGVGEEPGRWLGAAAASLSLDGVVDATALRRVLEGRDPTTAEPLVRTRPDRTAGLDLTFSAPKSVSVLYALGSSDTVAAVRAAHESAVVEALGWLDTQACWSRRGHNGIEAVRGMGFITAAFAHRSSRAGDPQLHTHVLVPNMVRCDDGVWRALDARALYRLAKTTGYLYQAHLRDVLTRELGVEWGGVCKGSAELQGVAASVLAEFSTRRHEIRAELAERGLTSAAAARVATLDTRPRKERSVDAPTLRQRWQQRARAHGVTTRSVERAVLARPAVAAEPTLSERAAILAWQVSADGLTHDRSTFSRADVVRSWCDALPAGAPIATIEALASETLADPRVVALASGPTARYSTVELLQLEQRLVASAVAQQRASLGIAHTKPLDDVLARRPELAQEQMSAIRQLTRSGAAIEVLVAAAGTGKTYSLDAAADAWQQSGYTVIGAALAARAAHELQANTAIPCDTIAKRLIELRDGTLPSGRGVVWVIDEAAMVATRQLAPLLDRAASTHTKIVLVGDPHQLQAIEAGGLLRGLADRLPTATLTVNRRQRDTWEQQALAHLRDGHANEAVEAYIAHRRVTTAPTANELRNHIVADWWHDQHRDGTTIMLAATHHDVDDLNARARTLVHHDGQLHGPALEVDGREYRAGDRIICTRNDRRLGVRNGTLATITHVDRAQRSITITTDSDVTLTLTPHYLQRDSIRHSYALTVHKAQGITVDRCLVLGSDHLDQQTAYTALSRGRVANRVYVVSRDEPTPEAHVKSAPALDWQSQLTKDLSRDGRERLAIDTPTQKSPGSVGPQPRELDLGL
jgi:conjugative relaxase-like TrwC/TraI family protein